MSGEGPRLIAHSYRDRARPTVRIERHERLARVFSQSGIAAAQHEGWIACVKQTQNESSCRISAPSAILGAVIAAVSVSSRAELPQFGLPHAADRIVLPERDFL